MISKTILGGTVIALGGICSVAVSQVKAPSISVELIQPGSTYDLALPVKVDFWLTNISKRAVSIASAPGNRLGNLCRIDLADQNGVLLEKRPLHGKRKGVAEANEQESGSFISHLIQPGERYHRIVYLSDVYRLGEKQVYRMSLTCIDSATQQRVKTNVVSVSTIGSSTEGSRHD